MAKLLAIINSLLYIDINRYILINNYDMPIKKTSSPLSGFVRALRNAIIQNWLSISLLYEKLIMTWISAIILS